jgi:ribosome-binding protein aMBF1 (putative translation factor)
LQKNINNRNKRGKMNMELKIYLVKKRSSIKEFSEQIGYSRNQIPAVANGKYKPSNRLAKVIENATNGEVKAEDLLKEESKLP